MKETRNFRFEKVEVRKGEAETDAQKLTGYAAVFNSRSEPLGGFVEIIAPGAFTKTLNENRKIKALAHHDWAQVLGSVGSGTLELNQDERGLHVEVAPPDTTFARDLIESVKRGDIDGMSFAFEPIIDDWEYNRETDEMVRTLKEVRLYEVSFVAYPAYSATSVGLRDLVGDDRASALYEEREKAKRERQAATQAANAPGPEASAKLRRFANL